MPQELVQVNVKNPLVRVVLILLLVAAGVWSYYVVRWYVGNTLAENFDPQGSSLRVAEMAVSLGPADPLTHWRIAQLNQKLLPLDQQARSIAEYEQAVKLSPNDYRFWMALGTAQEQIGDRVKAEEALKRAVALAPAYAYPRWYLGNLLLRSGRYEEAFRELRLAAEANEELQPQQFNMLWTIYSEDIEGLKKAIGENSHARAAFALYLLDQQRYDDGLRLWEILSDEEKKTNREAGHSVVSKLVAAKRYHDAAKVWNEIAPNERYRAEFGKIFDGSFEDAISYGPEMVFGWQVKGGPQFQIGIDPTKANGGARSLRLAFQVRTDIESLNVSQLVPVAANTEYDFECYVSTDKLETGSAPMIQILDAATGNLLAGTGQAPSGTNPWNRLNLTFKTTDKTEAVLLRIVRISCKDDQTLICPIFGSVWYDDFSFKRRG